MAAEIFKAASYRAIEACNAAEAMTFLESCNDIRTVFTDLEMPGQMAGVRLVHAIRQRWPHIRVVVTSGRGFQADDAMPIGVSFAGRPLSKQ